MTDKPTVESTPAGSGNGEQPKPQFQGQQGGEQTSQSDVQSQLDAAITAALKARGLDDLETLIDRKVQGTKDRRIQSLENQVDEFSQQLERYRQLTGDGKKSHEDAVLQMRMEQFLAQQQAPAQSTDQDTSQPRFGGRKDWWVTLQNDMLKSAGVPENDPDVAALIRSRTFANPQEYLAELTGLIARKVGGTQTAGALNMGSGNATPLGANQKSQLRAQYQERREKIRRGDVMALSALKREYLAKGFDPDAPDN